MEYKNLIASGLAPVGAHRAKRIVVGKGQILRVRAKIWLSEFSLGWKL